MTMTGSPRWKPDLRAETLRAGAATLDRRFLAWAGAWTLVSLVGMGLVAAIIPNPIFGRMIAVEPFAVVTWVISAPLLGLLAATWTAPPKPVDAPAPLGEETAQGSTLGTIAGVGVFFAIGCPICNKIALLLLGTSGALNLFAPIQPFLGVASVTLLVATLAWRISLRARPVACAA